MSGLRKGIFLVSIVILAVGILLRKPAVWLTGIGGALSSIFMEGL